MTSEQCDTDKLVEKFLELRRQALRSGITERTIARTFREERSQSLSDHVCLAYEEVADFVCNLTWKRVKSRPTLALNLLVVLLAVGFAVYRLHLFETVKTYVRNTECIISNNLIFLEVTRPLSNCRRMCQGLEEVPRERNITTELFVNKYAYSGVPVIIKDGTRNWTAMELFNFTYFQTLYWTNERALEAVENECQFFQYQTEFRSLKEVLNMSEARATFQPGEEPWYIGWSNCDPKVAGILRETYQRPYFLPNDSESSSLDWIFMGGSGQGASLHLDSVQRPSWQAQITGTKTWDLVPPPECESVCKSLKATVEKGDIIIVDTNQWYHATFIHPGEISITIGSEFD